METDTLAQLRNEIAQQIEEAQMALDQIDQALQPSARGWSKAGARVDAIERVLDDLHTLERQGLATLQQGAAETARAHGMTWEAIGRSHGITRQAAQMRWGRTSA